MLPMDDKGQQPKTSKWTKLNYREAFKLCIVQCHTTYVNTISEASRKSPNSEIFFRKILDGYFGDHHKRLDKCFKALQDFYNEHIHDKDV